MRQREGVRSGREPSTGKRGDRDDHTGQGHETRRPGDGRRDSPEGGGSQTHATPPDTEARGEETREDEIPEDDRSEDDRSGDEVTPDEASDDGTSEKAARRRGSGRAARRPRPLRRVLTWFAIGLAVLILGTAGAGYFYIQHLNGNLEKDDLSLGEHKLPPSDPNAAGQRPLNILLIGSDSRNSDRNVELGGARNNRGRPPLADVQMLLHLAADRESMSVMSIPRDTRVTIPKCTDPDDGEVYPETVAKINTSLQHGGPGCTVATWEALTGISIDHFMMVDFAGVVSMADAVGGVPVCVNKNIHDPRSGLRLRKGTTVIKGETALQWLRTRHGFGDGSDIGRSKAQHMYLSAMVRRLKAGTKLTDPGKLHNLAEAATNALTVDHGLGSVQKLYDLAKKLRKVPTKRITMMTMPWKYSPGGSYVLPKPGDAEKVFSLIRQDIPLDKKDREKKPKSGDSAKPSDPAAPKDQIEITVRNGTGTAAQPPVNGRAGTLTGHLAAEGFTQAVVDPAPASQVDTTISYSDPDQRGDALAVAEALGVPERLVKHSAAADEITLTVGADWRVGTTYPAESGRDGGEDGDGGGTDEAVKEADPLHANDKNACMKVNPNYTW